MGAAADETVHDIGRAVNVVAKLPLASHPGERWRYSVATDVLGYLVEVVSGQPFDVFLQERIFGPLGMVDTAFCVPPEKVDRFSLCYGPDPEAGLKAIEPVAGSRYLAPPSAPSGGGGLVSTAGDYLRFAQMLLNGGELGNVRLLGRKTVELMATNQLPAGVHPFEDASSGFGLGVSVGLDLGKAQTLGSVGSFGWGGAANTEFWVDPGADGRHPHASVHAVSAPTPLRPTSASWPTRRW